MAVIYAHLHDDPPTLSERAPGTARGARRGDREGARQVARAALRDLRGADRRRARRGRLRRARSSESSATKQAVLERQPARPADRRPPVDADRHRPRGPVHGRPVVDAHAHRRRSARAGARRSSCSPGVDVNARAIARVALGDRCEILEAETRRGRRRDRPRAPPGRGARRRRVARTRGRSAPASAPTRSPATPRSSLLGRRPRGRPARRRQPRRRRPDRHARSRRCSCRSSCAGCWAAAPSGRSAVLLIVRSGPDAGTVVEVGDEPFVLGRQQGCDLVVRDTRASRAARRAVAQDGDGLQLRDLGLGQRDLPGRRARSREAQLRGRRGDPHRRACSSRSGASGPTSEPARLPTPTARP